MCGWKGKGSSKYNNDNDEEWKPPEATLLRAHDEMPIYAAFSFLSALLFPHPQADIILAKYELTLRLRANIIIADMSLGSESISARFPLFGF
jgi:hypothetical protein